LEIYFMKKFVLLSVTLTLLLALVSACNSSQAALPAATEAASNSPITLTDGLGRTVTLDAPAQRIVSLAPSTTEILYAIGAGSQMVGRDSFSDYPEEAASLADVGGSMGDYSFESVAALNPDLVVATEINTAEQVKSLEDLGLTVYYFANPTDFDGLYQTIQIAGQLTGHETEAVALTDTLAQRVQAVSDKVAGAASTPVVFYELDGSDPAKPWTSGPGTFVDMLIAMAGGKNVGTALESSWAQISVEELIVQDPAVILLGDGAYGMTAEQVAVRAGWADIQAVKENKIHTFDDDLVSRAGPRLVDGLETLARLIHPELFE
jgi:iron complex transport system substrate-binding protein